MGRKRKSESKKNRISLFAWGDRLVCEWNLYLGMRRQRRQAMGRKQRLGLKKNRISLFAWGDGRLLFCHPFFQAGEALLGRLLDEGHVLGKMLLRVDLPFLATL